MKKYLTKELIKVLTVGLIMAFISMVMLQYVSVIGFLVLFGWFSLMFAAIIIQDKKLREFEKREENPGSISDGSHTFNELYYHRMVLFSIICNTYKDQAWKSWKHNDGTMFDDYFIVGVTTPMGDYTYHYHKDYWDIFNITWRLSAPVWDGHEPKDIDRLYSLLMS